MDITTERPSADLAIIALTGELDGSNFEQVIEAGRIAVAGGATRVVLDLGGLTYMGSSGLVAIHSIALIARGREPISPDDGWQAIHDIGSEAADEGAAGALPRRARPVRRPRPRAQRDGEPVPRPRGPGRRDRRRHGLTARVRPWPTPRWTACSTRPRSSRSSTRRLRLIPGGSIGVEDTDGAVVAARRRRADDTAAEVRSEMRRPIEAAGEPVGAVVVTGSVADRAALDAAAATVAAALSPRRDGGRRPPRGLGRGPRRPARAVAPLPPRRDDRLGGRPGPDRRLRPRRDRPAAPGRGRRGAARRRGPAGRVDRRRGCRRPPRRRGRSDRGAPPVRRSRPGRLRRPRRARPDRRVRLDPGRRRPDDARPAGRHRPGPGPDARPFDDPDRRLLAAVASQTAVALERATLQRELLGRRSLDDELAIGRRIQRSLMPQAVPEPGGLGDRGRLRVGARDRRRPVRHVSAPRPARPAGVRDRRRHGQGHPGRDPHGRRPRPDPCRRGPQHRAGGIPVAREPGPRPGAADVALRHGRPRRDRRRDGRAPARQRRPRSRPRPARRRVARRPRADRPDDRDGRRDRGGNRRADDPPGRRDRRPHGRRDGGALAGRLVLRRGALHGPAAEPRGPIRVGGRGSRDRRRRVLPGRRGGVRRPDAPGDPATPRGARVDLRRIAIPARLDLPPIAVPEVACPRISSCPRSSSCSSRTRS